VLLGAVGCVLLIVVANVANLLMARATVRARELAIGAAVGADRSMLMRQLLTESVLLAMVGGVLGVVLAFWGVDFILALDPGDVPRVAPIGVNGEALAFALLLSVATGVLFGVVPAWQASRPELQSALKESSRGTTGDGHRQYARAGLVLAEVSLSLVLPWAPACSSEA
jgi:ABC-type antimicrobial peptide transport system permease subunit